MTCSVVPSLWDQGCIFRFFESQSFLQAYRIPLVQLSIAGRVMVLEIKVDTISERAFKKHAIPICAVVKRGRHDTRRLSCAGTDHGVTRKVLASPHSHQFMAKPLI